MCKEILDSMWFKRKGDTFIEWYANTNSKIQLLKINSIVENYVNQL